MNEEKPKRKYNKRDDKSPGQSAERRNARTQAREKQIAAKAIEFGFANKSAMLTAIANGSAIVVKVEEVQTSF